MIRLDPGFLTTLTMELQ